MGDSPKHYNVYRVYDEIQTPRFLTPNYKQRNLLTWQQQIGKNIPLEHIDAVVYSYSTAMYEACLHDHKRVSDNKFLQHLISGIGSRYPQELLRIAKRIEEARSYKNDPWYYPASRKDGATTFDLLLTEVDKLEQEFIEQTGEDSFYVRRLQLQRVRLLFSLGRYDQCIQLWENHIQHWPADELMRTMIKDYIAGAYQHIGEEQKAIQYYLEQGNYRALAELSNCQTGNYAAFVRYMYDFNPDCAELIAPVLQYQLCDYYQPLHDSTLCADYYQVMQHILRTHRSQDMSIWYYTTAYLEDVMGYTHKAAQTIRQANSPATSQYMQTNIRLLRIYLDAKTKPYDANYQHQLYADLRWIDELVRKEASLVKDEWSTYDTWYIWANYSFEHDDNNYQIKRYKCYPYSMLRKIVLGEVAPRMKQANQPILSIALTNYADNLFFTLVAPPNSHCFFNDFFMSMKTSSATIVKQYTDRAMNPTTSFERFLAAGSYIDKDYLYDIVGTLYLRERNYKQAMEVLGQVSPNYHLRLNTRDCLSRDPFDANPEFGDIRTADSKYNFACKMHHLQQTYLNLNVDPNRRANAMIDYATGMRNSYITVWALTQYGQGYPVYTAAYKPWMTEDKLAQIQRDYEQLIRNAIVLFTEDEARADVQLQYYNYHTVITQYPHTAAAEFVRGHCDTYFDYHPELNRIIFQH
jgi:hypothetical protein